MCRLSFQKNILWQKEIIATIERITQLLRETQDDYEIEVRDVLTRLLRLCIKNIHQKNKKMYHINANDISKMKAMLLFIWQNYARPMTLSHIAKEAHISENSCLLCFCKVVGISPIQYLKNYRLEMAEQFLVKTDYKIIKICELTGFSDQSYFIKSFQKKYKITPLQYCKTVYTKING